MKCWLCDEPPKFGQVVVFLAAPAEYVAPRIAHPACVERLWRCVERQLLTAGAVERGA